MPRDRRDRDDDRPARPRGQGRGDDERPRFRDARPKGSSKVLLVVLGAVAGVFLLGAAGSFALFFWPGVRPPAPAVKVYDREEFRTLLMGKKEAEVVALVGKPSSTGDHGGGQTYWVYYGRTRDPITNEIDTSATVSFVDGVVVRVRF